MTSEKLKTIYERSHRKQADKPNGKLRQGYAKWLETLIVNGSGYIKVNNYESKTC